MMRRPRNVLLLIGAVIGLWFSWRLLAIESEDAPHIGMWSESIVVAPDAHGTWHLRWSTWPERKGKPRLRLEGYDEQSGNGPASFVVSVRGIPAGSVSSSGTTDPDGWIRLATESDDHLAPTVDRSTVDIEYRVIETKPNQYGSGHIRIFGTNDDALFDAINRRFNFFTWAAVIAIVALLGWLCVLVLPNPGGAESTQPDRSLR